MPDAATDVEVASLKRGRQMLRRPMLWRYAVAIFGAAAGCVLRWALTPFMGPSALPYVAFYPAVAYVAWFGGLGPGILVILSAAVAARVFFIPFYRLDLIRPHDFVADVAFCIGSAFIVGAIEAMHRARHRLLDEILERERLAREMTRARDALATTLASIGDGVIVTDATGVVNFLNPEAERLTRWNNEEAEGQPLGMIFHIINEETRLPVENPADKALRSGRTVGLANHTMLVAKDGTETPIDDSAAPIRAGETQPIGVVLVFRDVTEQRRADAMRTRLAAIVESTGDAIFTKNLAGTIESWNQGAERLFGYTADEIVGEPITRLVPEEYLSEEHEILGRMRSGLPSERRETVRLAKDRRRLDVAISISPLRDREGRITGASTIIHDISERKRAEQAVIMARDRLAAELTGMRRLHELSTLLLKETDLPAMLRRVLDASVELLGAEKGIVQVFDPKTQALQVMAQVGFDNSFLVDFALVSVAEDYVSSVALRRKGRVIVDDFATDPVFAHLRDGASRHRIAAAQSTPLFAGNGEVFGVLSTYFSQSHHSSESELRLLDLYAQQAERVIDHHRASETVRQAQDQLAQTNANLEYIVSERTAQLQAMVNELEHVSYAITHDMRAPLRAMSTFAQLLLEDAGARQLSPRALDYCRRIMTGASRLDALIREALNYTRAVLHRLPMGSVNLDKLIRGLIDTYPNLHHDKVDIQIDGRLPVVQGNESLLTQCFSNLLNNAAKFVPVDRKPQVRVWAEADGPMTRVSIQDNGIGIPPHAQSRLFGMFQKLDNQFEGTGIGLAIVRKVVEQMGGQVGVESEVDRGSRFWVELPLAKEIS